MKSGNINQRYGNVANVAIIPVRSNCWVLASVSLKITLNNRNRTEVSIRIVSSNAFRKEISCSIDAGFIGLEA